MKKKDKIKKEKLIFIVGIEHSADHFLLFFKLLIIIFLFLFFRI